MSQSIQVLTRPVYGQSYKSLFTRLWHKVKVLPELSPLIKEAYKLWEGANILLPLDDCFLNSVTLRLQAQYNFELPAKLMHN